MSGQFHAKHWLRLSMAQGVGHAAMQKLLRVYESPGAALRASEGELRRYVPEKTAHNIKHEDTRQEVKAALDWATQPNCQLLTLADESYPPQLLEIADAPPVLFARGQLEALQKPMVALVGSRNASAPGLRNTEMFARGLAKSGCAVVSGLAQGVDAAAHKGAMTGAADAGGGGGTVAVVGTGIDLVYPRENRALAAQIGESGLILSEFALGTRPLQSNFPRRNRIISGLARACVVMEATVKSGSLITAALAAEQGREVFAVPGSINSPMHRGCHQLIKQGAKLVEKWDDILEELNLAPDAGAAAAPRPREAERRYEEALNTGVSAADAEVLAYVQYQPTSIDDITARSGIAAASLLPILLELEMAGKIVCSAGGFYQRV